MRAKSADSLGLGSNANFLKRVVPERSVFFSAECTKINHRGKKQPRAVALTEGALCTFKVSAVKAGKFQKRIPLAKVRDAYLVEESEHEVLIRVDSDNDIHLEIEGAAALVAALKDGMVRCGHIEDGAQFGVKLAREVVVSLKDDAAAGAKPKARGSVIGSLMKRGSLIGASVRRGGGGSGRGSMEPPEEPSVPVIDMSAAGSIGATIASVASCSALGLDSGRLASDRAYAAEAFCEVMCTGTARDGLLQHLASKPDKSSEVAGECVTILRDENVEARRWAVKDLGMLIKLFDAKKLKDAKGSCRDGFVPIVRSQLNGLAEQQSGGHLGMEVYYALLEVALDIIIKPSEQTWLEDSSKRRQVEPFGKQLVRPDVLGLLLELSSGIETRSSEPDLEFLVAVLKDLNILLVMKKGNNFDGILKHEDWCSWLLPFTTVILASSSARKADAATSGSDVQKNLHKYLINAFALILFHVFEEEQTIKECLRCVLDEIARFSGWGADAVTLSQILFNGLLTKIVARARMWKNDFGAKQWPNLFSVLDVIEDFFFYCPSPAALGDSRAADPQPKLLRTAPARGAQESSKNGGIGLHLAADTGKCVDLKLAKAAQSALKQLAVKGGDSVPPGTSRKERETCKAANEYYDFFGGVIELLSEIDSTAGDKTASSEALAKVSAFLSKRSRRKRGFLTAGKTRGQITKALEMSMMRQQAQVLVRKKRPPPKAVAVVAVDATTLSAGEASAGGSAPVSVSALVQTASVSASSSPRRDGVGGAAASKESDSGAAIGGDAVREAFEDAVCAQCGQSDLTAENSLNAMGQWWHKNHFMCTHCHGPLVNGDDIEYIPGPTDGKPYCKRDFLKLFAPATCRGCLEPFKSGESMVEACGGKWHPECLKCTTCQCLITSIDDEMTEPTCADCLAQEEIICAGCNRSIGDTEDAMTALGRPWHRACFVCTADGCKCSLAGSFYSNDAEDGRGLMPYCEAHFMEQFVPKCPTCCEPVTTGGVVACGRTWHAECFTCRNPGGCSNSFGADGFLEQHGEPYCTEHYYELFGERCAGCDKVLVGASLSAMNKKWRELVLRVWCCCLRRCLRLRLRPASRSLAHPPTHLSLHTRLFVSPRGDYRPGLLPLRNVQRPFRRRLVRTVAPRRSDQRAIRGVLVVLSEGARTQVRGL